MAYTTAAKAAALVDGIAEGDIQAVWLTWADEIIDQWRGDRYPPTATAVTVKIDGTGTDTVYLPFPVTAVSAVAVEGDTLSSDSYALYKAGYLRRQTSSTQVRRVAAAASSALKPATRRVSNSGLPASSVSIWTSTSRSPRNRTS